MQQKKIKEEMNKQFEEKQKLQTSIIEQKEMHQHIVQVGMSRFIFINNDLQATKFALMVYKSLYNKKKRLGMGELFQKSWCEAYKDHIKKVANKERLACQNTVRNLQIVGK